MSQRIETRSHTDGVRAASYWQDQMDRHDTKMLTKRDPQEYAGVANVLLSNGLASPGSKMLCLGTRNNHERDQFRSLLSGVTVRSLDISPASKADHIIDFTELPPEWKSSWDIVYSNSLDHSFDSTATFEKWLHIVKPGGVLALGMDYGETTSASDICTFTESNVGSFIAARRDLELVGRAKYDYDTWVVLRLW